MRRPVGLIVLAATLVAGCSSEAAESEPLPKVTQSASAAASPSPSTPVPVLPPLAEESTPQGAGAFARHYYDVLTRAFSTADSSTLQALSAPTCEGCQAYIDSVERIRAEGQQAIGVNFQVIFAEAPGFNGTEARVDVIYDATPAQIRDAAGSVVLEEPASSGNQVELTLSRAGGRWTVARLVPLQ